MFKLKNKKEEEKKETKEGRRTKPLMDIGSSTAAVYDPNSKVKLLLRSGSI